MHKTSKNSSTINVLRSHLWKLETVMVHMPGSVKGKAWKLVRPLSWAVQSSPCDSNKCRSATCWPTGADAIFVSLSRVHPCYSEMADVSWSGSNKSQKNKKQANKDVTTTTNVIPRTSGPVTRLMTRFAREQEQPATWTVWGQASSSEGGSVIFVVKTFCMSNCLWLKLWELCLCLNVIFNTSLVASPYFCHFPMNTALCIPHRRDFKNLLLRTNMVHKTHAWQKSPLG